MLKILRHVKAVKLYPSTLCWGRFLFRLRYYRLDYIATEVVGSYPLRMLPVDSLGHHILVTFFVATEGGAVVFS